MRQDRFAPSPCVRLDSWHDGRLGAVHKHEARPSLHRGIDLNDREKHAVEDDMANASLLSVIRWWSMPGFPHPFQQLLRWFVVATFAAGGFRFGGEPFDEERTTSAGSG
jgi:hypothetical protein